MKNIIFFVVHPFDIIIFSGVINLLKEFNVEFNSNLIITQHRYFKRTKKI